MVPSAFSRAAQGFAAVRGASLRKPCKTGEQPERVLAL